MIAHARRRAQPRRSMPLSGGGTPGPAGRPGFSALAAVLLLVLGPVLTGCAPDRRMSADEFRDRAREVAARWQGSADDRAWRTGLVPLGPLEEAPGPSRLPRWARLSVNHRAWAAGFSPPADMLRSGPLHWPDGSTTTVPLATAVQAYARISRPGAARKPCPGAPCRPLRVTGATLGDMPVWTSRGRVRMPAWRFTVEGIADPFVLAAVDPSVIRARPRPRKGEYAESVAFDPVGPRTLSLLYGYGTCDRIHGARAYETEDLVVVDVDQEATSSGGCPDVLLRGKTTVTLARPLGGRLVLDAGSGLPLLPMATWDALNPSSRALRPDQ